MNTLMILIGVAVATSGPGSATAAQPVRVEREIPLRGDLAHAKELSGVARWGDFLIVCSDEGSELNVVRSSDHRLAAKVGLLKDEDDEIDMEGAASDERYVYVVGSHSLHREDGDGDRGKKKKNKREPRATPHEDSYSLFRLTLDDSGRLTASDRISLRTLLADDPMLGPYTKIPGKENGVDIEGIAVKDGRLYVGFRGPVLPGNRVPILSFEFDRPAAYLVKLVELGGQGIRDMTAVEDGLLILAGPVGEEDGSYKLYHWSGSEVAQRATALDGQLTLLGEVETDGKSKPEGIVSVAQTDRQWQVLLLCDGDDKARELSVTKP